MSQPELLVRSLLGIFHPEPESEGVKETPRRLIAAWGELTRGYEENPTEILARTFGEEVPDQVIALSGIGFHSLCEHHLLPFSGTVGIAYLPTARVVGLSKLARLVDCFSRRFQIQERMTRQIADALERELAPRGVAVLVEGEHSCMTIRGVMKKGATMKTSEMRGAFRELPAARAEVMSLLMDHDDSR